MLRYTKIIRKSSFYRIIYKFFYKTANCLNGIKTDNYFNLVLINTLAYEK